MIDMPILRPVPILTKGLSLWKRMGVWRHTTRKWEVMEDWNFDELFYVPKGFIFDGASVPRYLWWFLSPVGLLLIPGLIHDGAYESGRQDRKVCDLIFRSHICQVTDMVVIPWIAWAAVRLGGWKAWRKHRRND